MPAIAAPVLSTNVEHHHPTNVKRRTWVWKWDPHLPTKVLGYFCADQYLFETDTVSTGRNQVTSSMFHHQPQDAWVIMSIHVGKPCVISCIQFCIIRPLITLCTGWFNSHQWSDQTVRRMFHHVVHQFLTYPACRLTIPFPHKQWSFLHTGAKQKPQSPFHLLAHTIFVRNAPRSCVVCVALVTNALDLRAKPRRLVSSPI